MQEHLQFVVTSFLLAASLSLLAWRNGFFHLGEDRLDLLKRPTLNNVATAFLLFLAIEIIFVPISAGLYMMWKAGHLLNAAKLDPLTQGWFSLFTIVASAVGIVGYSLMLPKEKRRALYWGAAPHRPVRDFFTGIATWLLSYPWVLFIGNLFALIMLYFGPLPELDQVAVKQLKASQLDPMLFWSTILAIIFLVPLAEETLFRGFLQRGITPYLGRWTAIGASSLLFAFFHFSTSQGWHNIELILSLIILSCYLGLIYEKRGSIWAPVGLHMAFNAISVSLILWQEGNLI